ncbi:MAG: hypothetical protein HQK65_07120 [Desulfamplus sp.]|nr:hypothetical protein [Desulfamplus sp.]
MYRQSISINRNTLPLIWCSFFLGVASLWALIPTMYSLYEGNIDWKQCIAGFDNFFQPSVLFFTMAIILHRVDVYGRHDLLNNAIILYLIVLSLNALFSIGTIFFDLSSVVKYFVASTGIEQSVWARAEKMGRYTGIFNQPVEAGLAYTIGIFGWVFRVGQLRKVTKLYWCLILFIITGGIITMSKTFLFGGLPIGLFYWLFLGSHQVKRLRTFVGMILVLLVIYTVLSKWMSFEFILRFFNSKRGFSIANLFYYIIAGRYESGEVSTIKTLFNETINHAPLCGFGYGATSTLESVYIEYFYLGGGVALAFYLLVMCLCILITIISFKMRVHEVYFFRVLTIIMIIAGIGGPVLTMNRVSVVLVVFVSLSLGVISSIKKSERTTCQFRYYY